MRLSEPAAGAWIPRTCFKHGPPGRVGVELELVVRSAREPERGHRWTGVRRVAGGGGGPARPRTDHDRAGRTAGAEQPARGRPDVVPARDRGRPGRAAAARRRPRPGAGRRRHGPARCAPPGPPRAAVRGDGDLSGPVGAGRAHHDAAHRLRTGESRGGRRVPAGRWGGQRRAAVGAAVHRRAGAGRGVRQLAGAGRPVARLGIGPDGGLAHAGPGPDGRAAGLPRRDDPRRPGPGGASTRR